MTPSNFGREGNRAAKRLGKEEGSSENGGEAEDKHSDKVSSCQGIDYSEPTKAGGYILEKCWLVIDLKLKIVMAKDSHEMTALLDSYTDLLNGDLYEYEKASSDHVQRQVAEEIIRYSSAAKQHAVRGTWKPSIGNATDTMRQATAQSEPFKATR